MKVVSSKVGSVANLSVSDCIKCLTISGQKYAHTVPDPASGPYER